MEISCAWVSPLPPPAYLYCNIMPVRLYGLGEAPRAPVPVQVSEVLHFSAQKIARRVIVIITRLAILFWQTVIDTIDNIDSLSFTVFFFYFLATSLRMAHSRAVNFFIAKEWIKVN